MNITKIFNHNGQEYLADITIRSDKDYRTECAIFKSKDRQVTFDNAIQLYLKMDVDLTYDELERCVTEFIGQLDT